MLAVRLDNLGDVLMTGPALRALKTSLPRCEITLLASPAGAKAGELLPWVDEIIVHRAVWQDLGSLPFDPDHERALVDLLRSKRFDAALIFTSFSQTPHAAGYACYLAGIPLRLGATKEFGGGVLSNELASGPEEDGLHQVDRNLALLEAEGFDVRDRRLELRVPEEAEQDVDRALRDAGHEPTAPLIVTCPWASCPARTYPPEKMVEAAGRIGERLGWPVALSGHARDRAGSDALLGRLGGTGVDLVGRLGFAGFAALIKRAKLVLSNNSGPMHVAEATGTPLLVTYAGTELESQWRPRFTTSRLLRRPTPCQPCYAFTCPIDHPCLAIPVEEVVAAGLELVPEGRVDAVTG